MDMINWSIAKIEFLLPSVKILSPNKRQTSTINPVWKANYRTKKPMPFLELCILSFKGQ